MTEWRGAKRKLTKPLITKICKSVEKGVTFQTACLKTGISKSSFYKWQALGRKEEKGIYKDFVDALDAAMARAEARVSESVFEVSTVKQDGRVAMEWLRRRNPEEWNIPVQQQLTGAGGGSLQFIVDLGDSGTAQTGESVSASLDEVTSEE